MRWIDLGDGLGLAGRGDLDQTLGHLAQALLGPRLARLPGRPAQPVQLHPVALRAITGEQVDVLHRQVELGVRRVMQLQAVVWGSLHLQRGQAGVAADAVVDVDHQVAGRERRGFGQEVGRPPASFGPGQPVAQDVGLGDDRKALGLEPGLQRQHNPLGYPGIGGAGRVPVGREPDGLEPMIGQHHREPLGRPLRPGGEQHPLAGLGQGLSVIARCLEQVHAVLGPLGGEGPPELGAEIDHVRALVLEGREPAVGMSGDPGAPLLAGQVERFSRQSLVSRAAGGRFDPGVVGVSDQGQALFQRLTGQVVEGDKVVLAQEVEQRLQLLVEEGQPVLDTGPAHAFAH